MPELIRCTILVELHHGFIPGCRESLYEGFEETHDISEVQSVPRRPRELTIKLRLPYWKIKRLLNAERPFPMSWLWMVPKADK